MNVDAQVIAWLLTQATVTALLSNRIYPYGRIPQSALGEPSSQLPAATVWTISSQPYYTTSRLESYQTNRVQLDIWARTGLEVATISATIDSVLSGFCGMMNEMDVGGVFRNAALPIEFEPELRLYHGILDYAVHIHCIQEI